MSEGFAKSLAGDKIEIFSAGSRPAGYVSPDTIQIMEEVGIDISKQYSKGLSQIPQEKYDYIVTMGCGDACPHLPARYRIDWKIPDPIGQSHEFFQQTRNLVRELVTDLLKQASILSSNNG